MTRVTECFMFSIEMSSKYTEHLAGSFHEGESDEERWKSFLGSITYLVQVKAVHSVRSGVSLAAPAGRCCACVCVWHHSLLWKESVAAASRLCSPSATLWLHRPSRLSWEIYTSIYCPRHPCQHTDCLPVHSWWEATSHTLQRWKPIPSTGIRPATLRSLPVCHNSQRSSFVGPAVPSLLCWTTSFLLLLNFKMGEMVNQKMIKCNVSVSGNRWKYFPDVYMCCSG